MSKESSIGPLVTIAIPTYNRADSYLRETLESALTQTYPNVEIVVADNNSTDATRAVVASYADTRVRYFRHEFGIAPNDNFNFCLQQAKGAYFLMLHDDDKIDPEFIDSCMRAVGYDTRVGIILTGIRRITAKGTVIDEGRNGLDGLSIADFVLGLLTGKIMLYLCSTLYNTEGLRLAGGFHSRHNVLQDVIATVKVAAAMGRVDIEQPMASTRVHRSQKMHRANVKKWCDDSFELLDLLCELVPEKQSEVHRQGMCFFAKFNYDRANEVRDLCERFKAHLLVYRLFGWRYLPSGWMILRSTPIYRGLRQIKRRILGLPAWVDPLNC
jgi:glycosyltransferase involved in cell wall biosynthesis